MHEKAEIEQCMWKVQNIQGDFSLNHCPKSDLCLLVLQVKEGPNLSLTSGCVMSWTLLVLTFSLQIWLDTNSCQKIIIKKKILESVSLSNLPLSQMNSNPRKGQWEELYGWVCEVRGGVVRQVVFIYRTADKLKTLQNDIHWHRLLYLWLPHISAVLERSYKNKTKNNPKSLEY